ncbi:MAG: hypothetical protein K0S47_1568 [Herbinix sp.]|jgi:release factor glutamine methyltransferase|nr:hypothetical protein [Herbinix sp.]
METYKDLLQDARKVLKEHGIADADVDAWYLLEHVFGINRANYFLNQEVQVAERDRNQYLKLINRRATHVPLQYIIGKQEFMGLEFMVTPDVLIPRQDTEVLVEEVLKLCKGKQVLDLCTGSGCIIISLAKLSTLERAFGLDISENALRVASDNGKLHNVEVQWIQSDLYEKLEGRFDIIISNPPYIPSEDIESLMPEVKTYEPRMALDGAEDGLKFYRNITEGLHKHLKKDGFIFFEIGHNQGNDVKEILQNAGFYDVQIIKDLSGLDRVVVGNRR